MRANSFRQMAKRAPPRGLPHFVVSLPVPYSILWDLVDRGETVRQPDALIGEVMGLVDQKNGRRLPSAYPPANSPTSSIWDLRHCGPPIWLAAPENPMGFEVDFLAVGDGERGGDAIALRFGNLNGPRSQQIVMVIDGGWTETGTLLAKHIRDFYRTDTVDAVISTHPDDDHSNGLLVLLDELRVGNLFLHLPWKHADDIARMFRDDRVTDRSVREALRRSLDSACQLSKVAARKSIRVTEPFQGVNWLDGRLQILGPTVAYYESLLPHFRGTPEPKVPLFPFAPARRSVLAGLGRAAESIGVETLTDSGETSPENNTSAITFINADGRGLLFTGDAGMPALTIAADRLSALGISTASLDLIQVPHHGSRRNVGPTILNRIVGTKLGAPASLKTAVCSCPKASEKHPAKSVTNAFRRRGAPVYVTGGRNLLHHRDAPGRGWGTAQPLPLFTEVEAGDE